MPRWHLGRSNSDSGKALNWKYDQYKSFDQCNDSWANVLWNS